MADQTETDHIQPSSILPRPPVHRLKTVEDILRVATRENAASLCQDLANFIHFYLFERKLLESERANEQKATGIISTPLPPPPTFIDWIDDGKNDMNVTFKNGEKARFLHNQTTGHFELDKFFNNTGEELMATMDPATKILELQKKK